MTIFGALVTRGDVERAAIAQLRTWIPTYLAEVERQHGLPAGAIERPPDRVYSYRGGLDTDTFEESWLPVLTVVCQPFGQPELLGTGEYGQWFELQVAAIVVSGAEDTARELADHYGAAVLGAIVQRGSLGGIAQRTVLASGPTAEFKDPDVRRLIQAVTTFRVYACPVVSEGAGPAAPDPPASTQYGGSPDAPFTDWPVVVTESVAVSGVPLG